MTPSETSAEHEPDYRTCMDCTGFNLRKAMRAVGQHYDDALRPAGLRGTQFSLLAAAKIAGPVTVSRLAEMAVMDRTTLTRNLNVLEKQGLVAVVPGADRRTRRVVITERGVTVLRQAYPLWQQAQDRLAAKLGADRLQALRENMATLVDATLPR
ncbi:MULTISPECIES: MarR family winged helix-turn-helix transcriptional regulator [Methylococcus]|nr:MarR family winged helix-turn-helix transcriptional regulator [Methylococcus capsulatus]CAI8809940.1 Transcriptional regulator, MarR family [Methylococcus capsulatus]